jgi:hypothetical protein
VELAEAEIVRERADFDVVSGLRLQHGRSSEK